MSLLASRIGFHFNQGFKCSRINFYSLPKIHILHWHFAATLPSRVSEAQSTHSEFVCQHISISVLSEHGFHVCICQFGQNWHLIWHICGIFLRSGLADGNKINVGHKITQNHIIFVWRKSFYLLFNIHGTRVGSSLPRTVVLFARLAFNQLKNGCTCTFVAPPQECPKKSGMGRAESPKCTCAAFTRTSPLGENFNLKIIKTSHSRPFFVRFLFVLKPEIGRNRVRPSFCLIVAATHTTHHDNAVPKVSECMEKCSHMLRPF